MKIDWKIIGLIIAGIIIVVLLIFRGCGNGSSVPETITQNTKLETIKIRDTVSKPEPYKVEVPKYIDTVKIDTAAIIRDYYSEKYYSLNYRDTNILSNIDIKVLKNSIDLEKMSYDILSRHTYTTKTIPTARSPTMAFWLGADAGYNFPNSKFGIFITGRMDYRKNSFSISYDPFNKTFQAGYQYQIFKSKK